MGLWSGIRATLLTAVVAATLTTASPMAQFTLASTALRDLPGAIDRHGVDETLAAVAGAAAWLVVAWAGCVVLLVVLGTVPGAVGRVASATAERVVPGAVRRLLGAALGIGLAAGAATPAAASPMPAPAPSAVAQSLDWPVATEPRTPVEPAGPAVTVRNGDCLWSITAARLGPHAPPRAVAAAWPRWWAANRNVIGTDPDLLHPGQRLIAPHLRDSPTRTP